MVLLVLTLGMIGGAVTVAVLYAGTEQPADAEDTPANQLGEPPGADRPAARGPTLAGDIPLEPPVIYCLDAGDSMREFLDYARAMTYTSIASLRAEQTFAVLLFRETGVAEMPGGFQAGGTGGIEAAKAFLGDVPAHGATGETLEDGLAQALERTPGCIVLFAAKPVDPDALAARAKEAGVTIHTVALGGDPDARSSLRELAEAAGGRSRAYSRAELESRNFGDR